MVLERQGTGITLVLGGASSGKSAFAEKLAHGHCGPAVAYLATLDATDAESAAKITIHRARRPREWVTLEVTGNLSASAASLPPAAAVFFDSLTCYVARSMPRWVPEVAEELCAQLRTWRDEGRQIYIVSDELGAGVVPANESARLFREALGQMNQAIAGLADTVFLVVAGVPVTVKGG